MRSYDELIAASGLPRTEARALLELASGRAREWLIAHGDEPAPAPAAQRFVELSARRRDGEPVAYLTGSREFYGRRFAVTPDVLIPRPETELLVRLALERLRTRTDSLRVLDLGTGSGVIAITIALEAAGRAILATDRSEAALRVARINRERLDAGGVEFAAGSWFDAAPAAERFALVVSNPPYVAAGDPHLQRGDLRFEPRTALAGGAAGLDALRQIAGDAASWLAPGGWLLLEHGFDQARQVRASLAAAGLAQAQSWRDDSGHERVSGACRLALE